eukprot:c14169_g1_i1 orf=3-227(-)
MVKKLSPNWRKRPKVYCYQGIQQWHKFKAVMQDRAVENQSNLMVDQLEALESVRIHSSQEAKNERNRLVAKDTAK